MFLCMGSFGQSAGFKDLSTASSRPPKDQLARPSEETCPVVKSAVDDGAALDSGMEHRDAKVEFSVTETSPKLLRIGSDLTATVRLRNLGSDAIGLPWQTDGETVTRVSANGEEEDFEVADIALRLSSGREQIAPVWLSGAGSLFARPGIESSYVRVEPGQWVDVKIRARVQCSNEGLPCGKIVADRHASLTAWWYQRQLTHRIHGCNENHGNFVIRELDSKALRVVVAQATTSKPK